MYEIQEKCHTGWSNYFAATDPCFELYTEEEAEATVKLIDAYKPNHSPLRIVVK